MKLRIPTPAQPKFAARLLARCCSRSHATLLQIILCGVFSCVPAVWSQPAPPAGKSPGDEIVQLMTYTLTASSESGYYSASALSGTRVQTALRDLPMTVNVVTSELIADLGAIKLEEALLYTPSVRKTGDFESNLALRGFRETTPRFNGFPTGNISRWDSAVIDRVEVLKGPTAAAYGSTAEAGGFVNIITKKPLFKTQRNLSLSINDHERYRAALDVTGPLAFGGGKPQFAYRLIGSVQEGSNNGWRDFADGKRLVLSPSLTWRPSNRTEVTLEIYRDRYDRVMDVATQPVKGTDQSRLYFNELSPGFNINGPGSFDDYFMDAAFLYITHQINPQLAVRTVSANFNAGQDFLRRQGFTERPNSPGVLATFGLNRHLGFDRKWHRADVQWKEQTRLGKTTALLGVQYNDDRDRSTNRQDTTEPPFSLFSFTPQAYAFKPLSTYREVQKTDAYNRGWLANVMVSQGMFNDRLTLFGNYARKLSAESRAVNYLAGESPATVPWNSVEDPDDFQFGTVIQLTPKINVYGLYGKDIRLNARDNSGNRLPNITQSIVEGGFKFNFGSRLNGAIAVFDIERANLATRDFSQPNQPLTAAGGERSRVVEGELYFTPVENLDVIFGYAYIDGKITSNKERPDLVGTALQDAPRNAASSWARYRFARGSIKGLSLGLGVVYTDERYPFGTMTAQRRAFAVAPRYVLLNAMARYAFPLAGGREFSTQLTLSNLTNEKYFEGTDYGAPFTANLGVNLRF
jgi:iron complex outermembrane receptor protein